MRLKGESVGGSGTGKLIGVVVGLFLIAQLALFFYWNNEPDPLDISLITQEQGTKDGTGPVIGYTTTVTLEKVVSTLLDKPGGYMSNDVTPPTVLMDDIPSWEFGVLVQIRDLARVFRNDFSRAQSQSVEDKDLSIVEPQFNFDSDSWLFPPSEGEYREGLEALQNYRKRLFDKGQTEAQFFARADNLVDWLAIVEKRLGSLSQRLSASVGQVRINTDLAGDTAAAQSTPKPAELEIKTPWTELDNVFYEARGTAWALIAFMKAIEHDFADVLNKKAALVSLRQIIRELEGTQDTVWSPVVLNGSGFSLFANYSLVMASYISRANAAIIDLKRLLQDG
ncbi:MAG: DUF2333 family protein [Gammaproteobacteria bacterium]|nr:DUF2333 family protein [Gammaproteobacteria bacterium]